MSQHPTYHHHSEHTPAERNLSISETMRIVCLVDSVEKLLGKMLSLSAPPFIVAETDCENAHKSSNVYALQPFDDAGVFAVTIITALSRRRASPGRTLLIINLSLTFLSFLSIRSIRSILAFSGSVFVSVAFRFTAPS